MPETFGESSEWHRTADEDFNDILTKLQEINPEDNKVYLNGDLGNGRLFADVFKEVLRYVPERKMWFFYDGIKWTKDTGTLKTMELCKDLALSLIQYAGAIRNEAKRSYAVKLWNQWSTRRCREICIKEAQSVYPIPMAEFDKNIYLFNCRNGTLDLKHGIFREHSADDYITKVSMVDYDPLAKSERFNSFVDKIMSSDKEKTLFLKKSLGYAVTGETKYECMFFLYGETTRNGKGTLMESVLSVMGDYGKAVRPETIAVKSNPNSSQPSEDIVRLAGIRFANIAEPRRGLCLNAAQVKSMTGNYTLNARFLHENSFDFKPQFKLYVNTNYLPIISDMTIFTSGRVQIIPFDKHFEEDEQDKTLKEEFSKDEVKSAIGKVSVDLINKAKILGEMCPLPYYDNNKYMEALAQESLFRRYATCISATDSDFQVNILDNKSVAEWELCNIQNTVKNDIEVYKNFPLNSHKLSILTKIDASIFDTNTFDIEKYFIKQFAKAFGKTEENAFIKSIKVCVLPIRLKMCRLKAYFFMN